MSTANTPVLPALPDHFEVVTAWAYGSGLYGKGPVAVAPCVRNDFQDSSEADVEAWVAWAAGRFLGPMSPYLHIEIVPFGVTGDRTFAVRSFTLTFGRIEDSGWRVWVDGEFIGAVAP